MKTILSIVAAFALLSSPSLAAGSKAGAVKDTREITDTSITKGVIVNEEITEI